MKTAHFERTNIWSHSSQVLPMYLFIKLWYLYTCLIYFDKSKAYWYLVFCIWLVFQESAPVPERAWRWWSTFSSLLGSCRNLSFPWAPKTRFRISDPEQASSWCLRSTSSTLVRGLDWIRDSWEGKGWGSISVSLHVSWNCPHFWYLYLYLY